MSDTTASAGPPSGRFLLRISPGLHATLRQAADAAGLSLNELCARKLADPNQASRGPASDIISRASAQFGADLIAVLAFGSWARGEATEESDVDLLVAVSPDVPIVRGLYHPWDDRPPTWEGRRVQVHIVHLPPIDAAPSGFWSEAALDGIVLFDPTLELSRRLTTLRRAIAQGVVHQRGAPGRAYWVEAD